MQVWRNGRRACLRGKWETVWVRLPPPAPSVQLDTPFSFDIKILYDIFCRVFLFALQEILIDGL